MNSKPLTRWMTVSCLGGLCLNLAAAPLQRTDLPAEPAWALHIDVDALHPSGLGRYILSELEKPAVAAKLAAFQAMFNVDPRKQIHGVTVYSAGPSTQDGVLIVYADFDPDRLVTMAKAAHDYKSANYKQYVVHNWLDDKKSEKNGVKPRVYATIAGSRVIFGQRERRVTQALDVIDGSAANLSRSSAFPELGAAASGKLIEAVARKLELPKSDPNAAIFKLSKLLRFQLNEAGDQVNLALTLEANDAEVASHISSIANGLISLLKLQQDKPETAKLAEALSLRQEEAKVLVQANLPVQTVVELVKADAARKAKAAKKGE